MENRRTHTFTFEQLCATTSLSSQTVIEIIDHGIVDPEGSDLESWRFDAEMISIAEKASRLHRDLEIDWSGIALALSLLDEVAQLRRENQHLRARLNRFLTGE